MQTIKLNGQSWRTEQDFYEALAFALGSVKWHGRNADAFLETMVYYLELNRVQPPYQVVVREVPNELKRFLTDFASWVREAREERKQDPEWGDDIEVEVLVD
jgi:hypothetical protein